MFKGATETRGDSTLLQQAATANREEHGPSLKRKSLFDEPSTTKAAAAASTKVDVSLQTGEKGEVESAVKAQTMPFADAFRLFAQYEEMQGIVNGNLAPGEEIPTKPVIVLSKQHLESHASVQSFAQNVEVALRYMYVIGPVIRTILAVIEVIASVFASTIMALQACFITAENDSLEAKVTADIKRDEMFANAQYTLTYAFHGLANAVRAIFEATIIGHIVLNVSYDREYRVEYDLADRNRGDIYHTRIFSSNVKETTGKPRDAGSSHGETRYLQAEVEYTGVLASRNEDFQAQELFDGYLEAAKATFVVSHLKTAAAKELSEHAKDFRSAEDLVKQAVAFTKRYEAANKAIDEQIKKLTGENTGDARAKLEEQRPKLTAKEEEMVLLARQHLNAKKREEAAKTEGSYKKAVETLYGGRVHQSYNAFKMPRRDEEVEGVDFSHEAMLMELTRQQQFHSEQQQTHLGFGHHREKERYATQARHNDYYVSSAPSSYSSRKHQQQGTSAASFYDQEN